MKAYKHLVKHAIASDYSISIYDWVDSFEDPWLLKRSASFKDIMTVVKSVSEPTLKIYDKAGVLIGSALISAFGLEPEETVIDHSDVPFFNAWYENYTKTL